LKGGKGDENVKEKVLVQTREQGKDKIGCPEFTKEVTDQNLEMAGERSQKGAAKIDDRKITKRK